MKRLPIVLLAIFTLTGCAALTPTATPTPSPTIDIGPVELTESEAAERYLDLVCATNQANEALDAAIIAGEPEWLNGGAPDPSAIKAAATESMRLARLAVELIDDEYYIWPGDVGTYLQHIRETFIQDLSLLSAVANVTRFEDAYFMPWPERTSEQASAGQEIRYQLGLDADTTASCVGYETGLEDLHQEMIERAEYLEQFEPSTPESTD
jgi:hypothetical protein